jgi:DNA polymerase II large subunit
MKRTKPQRRRRPPQKKPIELSIDSVTLHQRVNSVELLTSMARKELDAHKAEVTKTHTESLNAVMQLDQELQRRCDKIEESFNNLEAACNKVSKHLDDAREIIKDQEWVITVLLKSLERLSEKAG